MGTMQQKQDWEIRSRGEACSQCERGFADGESFYARLLFGPEGYQREDFCVACWAAVADQPAMSIWQSVFRLPPPPPPETLKKETAESLLRKLIDEDEQRHANPIYILAVMLERRRILIERDVQVREDGIKLRVYEHRHTNESFVIPDPELRLAELEHVQEEVVALLGGGEGGEIAGGEAECAETQAAAAEEPVAVTEAEGSERVEPEAAAGGPA